MNNKNLKNNLKYLFIGISILCLFFVLYDVRETYKKEQKNNPMKSIDTFKVRGIKLNSNEYYAQLVE